MEDLLARLNPAQREAVLHLNSPLMIVAGAGTGKTRVITHRIAFLHLECGIPLHQIMAVTFTNKAAREMRERVCRLIGIPDTPSLAIGTFHSRCATILRRESEAARLDPSFAILDDKDQLQAIKRVLKELEISDKLVRPGQVQTYINLAKMRLLTPKDCEEEDEQEVPYAAIYARYQETIDKAQSVDFEDLMMRTVLLFQNDDAARRRWSDRYRYLLVDEYQDTNVAQFLLTNLLARDHKQICIVGDEDQSIYSWRGAEISNLLDFEKSFPGAKLVKLEQNYRSTGNILKAASTVIARNTQRIGKTLFTEHGEGDLLAFVASANQEDEGDRIARECSRLIQAEGVDPNEIAVFYRGHWLSRAVEDAMRRYRIPYRMVGGLRFYDRAEIKDLLGFMRLAVNPHDDLAFERMANRPPRGAGDKTLASIAETAARNGLSMFAATDRMIDEGEIKGKARAGLGAFVDGMKRWKELSISSAPSEVLERIIADTEYKTVGVGDPKSIEGESRLENIAEFEGLLSDFQPTGETSQLAEFLTTMALDSAVEKDDGKPKVNLLTIHNAKGLEYLHVYLVGMEKGVFPTSRAEESFEEYAVEEERRLFYVAITRARKNLTLMYSASRNRPDMWSMNQPSIFLSEMPPEVFDPSSVVALRRLLPYGWGGNAGPEEREIVYDDDGDSQPRRAQPAGAYSRLTSGTGRPGGFAAAGAQKPRFTVGMRVLHRHMGAGIISEMGGRPGMERVRIDFDDGRAQDFVLKYAPLTAEG